MQLHNFDHAEFLRNSWQNKPILIRNAWRSWSNPLEPDELAGLACEEGIESRLVIRLADGWILEHGPLPAERFGEVGNQPWTLLVQSVDHHVPAVAALLDPLRFIPNWRVDDVMVSYAVDGGGVGAHFDQYDVFLVQGLGTRRWQIGERCDEATELLPHDDLRLLAKFEPTDEWILEPGDMLYVPPGFAHNGIAVGDDCMTYSIGFRAPSRGELIARWAEHVVAELEDDDRYADPDLALQDNPGEISAGALARMQAMVAERLLDPEGFAQWFGEYCTAPKDPEIDWRPERPMAHAELRAAIDQGRPLLRNPASRFSFVHLHSGSLTLFVDGRSYNCADIGAGLAKRICASSEIVIDQDLLNSDTGLRILMELLADGSVAFEAFA